MNTSNCPRNPACSKPAGHIGKCKTSVAKTRRLLPCSRRNKEGYTPAIVCTGGNISRANILADIAALENLRALLDAAITGMRTLLKVRAA